MTNNKTMIDKKFSGTELIINFLLVISSGALLWIAYSVSLIPGESGIFLLNTIIEITKSIPGFYIIPFIIIFILLILSIFTNRKVTRVLGSILSVFFILITFSIVLSPFGYATTSNSAQSEALYVIAKNANFAPLNIFLVLSICLIVVYIIRINKK